MRIVGIGGYCALRIQRLGSGVAIFSALLFLRKGGGGGFLGNWGIVRQNRLWTQFFGRNCEQIRVFKADIGYKASAAQVVGVLVPFE